MTSINDIPEDPLGFRIVPEGENETRWKWVRISDETTRSGFASREDAIDDAKDHPRE